MKILLVDDNAPSCAMFSAILEHYDHEARFAGNVLAALARLDAPGEPLPDVIVLDPAIPGMDGDELARLHRRWPGLLVLARPFDPDQFLTLLDDIERRLPTKEL